MENDTIAAPATALGESAIAVVRLSGPAALPIAAQRFQGRRSPERRPSHRILFRSFRDSRGAPIDSVLLSVSDEPTVHSPRELVSERTRSAAVSANLTAMFLQHRDKPRILPDRIPERIYF